VGIINPDGASPHGREKAVGFLGAVETTGRRRWEYGKRRTGEGGG